jgi:stage V sporulation protein S
LKIGWVNLMSDEELYNDYNDDTSSEYVSHHTTDDEPAKPDIIKVSARSRSTAVAGAIAGVIREHRYAEVQAIGAGAVNQAVKALAIARGYLTRDEIDIVFTPFFTEVTIDGQERTAVRFAVELR